MNFSRLLQCLAAPLCALCAAQAVYSQELPPVVRVAVQASLDPEFFLESYEPTIAYLKKRFPGTEFRRTDYSSAQLIEAIKQGRADLFFADSGIFTFLHIRYHIMQVATRLAPHISDPCHAVGMTVVVPDRSPVRSIEDLKESRVAVNDPERFTTWIAFQGVLAERGVDFGPIESRAVVANYEEPPLLERLSSGQADAAVLPSCSLERLEAEGRVRKGAFRVLEPQPITGYPCRSTSALFPDTVFGATPRLTPGAVKTLMVAALTMPPTRRGYSWGIANDFHPVDKLYKTLKIGPYSYLRETNWKVLWEQYKSVVFALLAAAGFLIFHTLRANELVRRRTRELQAAIDEKTESDRQAREARERLSHMERAGVVSEMSSLLVHEVRQPLATLMTYAGGLRMYFRKKGTEDPVVNQTADEIVSEAQRVSDIVERVRSYAKADTHPRHRMAAAGLIERALRTFSHSTTSSGVSIRRLYRSPAGAASPEVLVEPLELELAIVNLLKNGAACMGTLPEAARRLDIGLECEPPHVRISVRDYGPPVSDKLIAGLARPTRSLKRDGLGLGLTIVRRIMESHGGSVQFRRAAPGPGLVATLTLPLVPAEDKEN
ncbi:sensor histidine kinase [Mesosutterella sp. OilRF-GAM-744-9]|uniref:histidine kinase n=1 Tax=Mesosutterella porci TaxID=2915351 RepID=A0ABS9MPR3_9BURK|nr:sensor histidine kinase [Mesosutterella sp. oilRF-744-WT-GAM-9]MCG5030609.1 sensor histidine kinase [Mesosutterella sp. oilRF-744-WT-GAM-9]